MKIEYYIETTLLKFLKTKSIDSIRVIDLIDETGVCKGTFYKYYQDKYSLMIRCFKNYFYDDILSGADGWESFITRSLSAFRSSPAVVLNAFNSQDINSLRSYHEDWTRKFLFKDCKEGGEYYRYSVEVFARYATEIIIEWLKSKCGESYTEVLKKMKAIMPVAVYEALYVKGENKDED